MAVTAPVPRRVASSAARTPGPQPTSRADSPARTAAWSAKTVVSGSENRPMKRS